MIHRLRGDVRSPQPQWWRHVATITDGAFAGLGDVVLIPMYGTWRANATWIDAQGTEHCDSLSDVTVWTAPCSADAMGHRVYFTATLAD